MKNSRSTFSAIALLALSAIESPAQSIYEPYAFTTLAGGGGFMSPDQTGSAARFNTPGGVAVDSAGNVYVADTQNHAIRKVTPAGVPTTLAGLAGSSGSADGTGSTARFNSPNGVAVDSAGNVYVADQGNHTIRKVTPEGAVTTLAGRAGSFGSANGTNSAALFREPNGVAVDSAGNIYVADSANSAIRQVTLVGTNWVVRTLAGLAGSGPGSADGTNSTARFNYPFGVAVDNVGNLYVADPDNQTIRKVTPVGTNWVVTTIAGVGDNSGNMDGAGNAALFTGPAGVAVDSAGNVYVADQVNYTIRKLTAAGAVTTLAGLAGQGGRAVAGSDGRFNFPQGLAVDGTGNVYVVNRGNSTIQKVTPAGAVTTLAGLAGSEDEINGAGPAARFVYPKGVAVDRAGNVYVASTIGNTIRKVTPTGVVTTVAGLAFNEGSTDGTGAVARFNFPAGVAVDGATNVYVADTGNHTIRKVTPARAVTTLAGLAGNPGSTDGIGKAARFNYPSGLAVDGAGNVYVADTYNNTIRKLTPIGTNWVVTTLGGMPGFYGTADGTGSAVRFSNPNGVAVDSAGNLYVADFYFNTIRKGFPAPRILHVGFNSAAQFSFDLTGLPGQSVVVEASSNLMDWLPIWTNTFTGSLNFSDPQSGASFNRFYRSHTP